MRRMMETDEDSKETAFENIYKDVFQDNDHGCCNQKRLKLA
jgi:hypothetical protein